MSTKLDMTPEEKAEFEAWFSSQYGKELMSASGSHALAWAACAKLYRERITELTGTKHALQMSQNVLMARTKELEAENKRLRKWLMI